MRELIARISKDNRARHRRVAEAAHRGEQPFDPSLPVAAGAARRLPALANLPGLAPCGERPRGRPPRRAHGGHLPAKVSRLLNRAERCRADR